MQGARRCILETISALCPEYLAGFAIEFSPGGRVGAETADMIDDLI